ncbi:MAG: iron-containing redox enzyme family protein [Bdellovibrionota bacterium]
MNIAESVKRKTEDYSHYLKTEPFNAQLQAGKLTAESYANFLFSIEYLIKHTPIHLRLAIETSIEHPELAEYFRHKFDEEQGHDQWAIDDRAKLEPLINPPERVSGQESMRFYPQVSLEMWDYVREIERMIRADPRIYISYIYYTEYLTVLVADKMKAGLSRCGFGDEPVEVLTKHAELDVHHTSEGIEAIEQFLPETTDMRAAVEKQIDAFIKLHIAMFKACLV